MGLLMGCAKSDRWAAPSFSAHVRCCERGAPVRFPLGSLCLGAFPTEIRAGLILFHFSYCLGFQQWANSFRLWLIPMTLKARVCFE
jgi:hypothetical protein